jgi:hypothetical protein
VATIGLASKRSLTSSSEPSCPESARHGRSPGRHPISGIPSGSPAPSLEVSGQHATILLANTLRGMLPSMKSSDRFQILREAFNRID